MSDPIREQAEALDYAEMRARAERWLAKHWLEEGADYARDVLALLAAVALLEQRARQMNEQAVRMIEHARIGAAQSPAVRKALAGGGHTPPDEPWLCPDCYRVHRFDEPCPGVGVADVAEAGAALFENAIRSLPGNTTVEQALALIDHARAAGRAAGAAVPPAAAQPGDETCPSGGAK